MVTDAAFAELFAARAAVVRRSAYLMCGDWHQAEDLTQTAFAKLFAAWPRLRDAGAAEAYLRRTLARTYIDDNKRGWKRERATEVLPETAVAIPDGDDRLDLLEALTQVPARQRACLVLRYFEDLTVEATADVLGCSAGTVKSNTARGVAALRRVLGDRLPELTTLGGHAS